MLDIPEERLLWPPVGCPMALESFLLSSFPYNMASEVGSSPAVG